MKRDENQNVEYNESWHDKCLEWIYGYANAKPIHDVPLIVFGDHTCAFEHVDFPFVRGADGTQLLKTDESVVSMGFLCAYLQTAEIEHSGKYERHFKYLKRMDVPVPPPAEQRKVVAAVEAKNAAAGEAKLTGHLVWLYARRIRDASNRNDGSDWENATAGGSLGSLKSLSSLMSLPSLKSLGGSGNG